MSIALNTSTIVQGFALATVVPAMASTLKQALREAADALHCLARHHQRVVAAGGVNVPVDAETRRAARRFGKVMVEQAINGTALFMAVKLSLLTFGAVGGIAAQLAITGNTIVTPRQTQHINPARTMFESLGCEPDWVDGLSDGMLAGFAYQSGAFASFCGYGDPVTVNGAHGADDAPCYRVQVVPLSLPWPGSRRF